jgi:sulfatase modifying factor 1
MGKTIAIFLLVAIAIVSEAWAVAIDWLPVGNSGNAADTAVMTSDGTTGYGSVNHNYRIDKFDVTNAQYAEFLNTKDPTGANALGLWTGNMGNTFFGGIGLNAGNANGSKYTLVSGRQSHPVNFVTWYDAIRFANWLNNGQGNGDTESGAYTLGHDGSPTPTPMPSNGLDITRNADAKIFLPSEDEWYKAAYYNPGTSSYFHYPTSSDTAPVASSPTGLPNHVNDFPGGPGNLTNVGAYTGTTSPYGLYDMGGNVYQWNESLIGGSLRGLRGGSFSGNFTSDVSSSLRIGIGPTEFRLDVGFRVAMIPEPSSIVLAVMGAIGLAAWGW